MDTRWPKPGRAQRHQAVPVLRRGDQAGRGALQALPGRPDPRRAERRLQPRRGAARPPAPRGGKPMDDFEVRFLEFAYQTTATLNVTVGRPRAEAADRRGRPTGSRTWRRATSSAATSTTRATSSSPSPAAPTRARRRIRRWRRVARRADGAHQRPRRRDGGDGLVLNVIIPGVGSLVAGRTSHRRGAAGPVGRRLPAVPGLDRFSDDARRLDLVAGDRDPNSGRVETSPNCLVIRAVAIL